MKTLSVTLATIFSLASSGCASNEADQESRSGYLFGLSEEDVEEIHDAYVPDEPIEETRARLTAPFGCAQYDDLCEQVGQDAAIQITEQLVDLALEGEEIEVVESQLSRWLSEGMDERSNAEDDFGSGEDAWVVRSSGTWIYSSTVLSRRLRVRNGITTPVIGKRRAWTETQFLRGGSTSKRTADTLCVNTGANRQTITTYTSTDGYSTTQIENLNPGELCFGSAKTAKTETRHFRGNGVEGSGIQSWYDLKAKGSARALNNGVAYSVTGLDHAKTYY